MTTTYSIINSLLKSLLKQLRLGKKSDGLGGLRKLAEREPLSYYGMLSRVRLRDEGQKLPLFLDPARQLPDGRSNFSVDSEGVSQD